MVVLMPRHGLLGHHKRGPALPPGLQVCHSEHITHESASMPSLGKQSGVFRAVTSLSRPTLWMLMPRQTPPLPPRERARQNDNKQSPCVKLVRVFRPFILQISWPTILTYKRVRRFYGLLLSEAVCRDRLRRQIRQVRSRGRETEPTRTPLVSNRNGLYRIHCYHSALPRRSRVKSTQAK